MGWWRRSGEKRCVHWEEGVIFLCMQRGVVFSHVGAKFSELFDLYKICNALSSMERIGY